ncbi:MAG: aminotransferase class I/II-fold pyridoxal phosphate-dependent enzyme [Vampirovibrionales bacterium]
MDAHGSLIQALMETEGLALHRFFVPAHAGIAYHPWLERVKSVLPWDVTELPLLDTLSEPEGVLQALQTRMAAWAGAGASFCLVNGASVGLHAALMSVCTPTDGVLAPRNVHRATYAGFVHAGVTPYWFYPTYLDSWGVWGAVTPEQLTLAWEALSQEVQRTVKALVLTSPTYEGMISPLRELVAWCHARGLVCIVDESHGSYFSIHEASYPYAALHAGADIVVQSWHKTLGSLTQSAVLHLGKGFATPERCLRVQQVLNSLQTTSPSYLLLVSLEACLDYWQSEEGFTQWHTHQQRVQQLYTRLETALTHPNAHALFPYEGTASPFLHDPLKLWIRHGGCTPDYPVFLEEQYGLAFEQCTLHGVLYMLHPHLPSSAFEALERAWSIPPDSSWFQEEAPYTSCLKLPTLPLPVTYLTPREAFFHQAPKTYVQHPQACVGKMAAEVVVHCPPGVPVLYTGECIQEAHLPWLFPSQYGIPSERETEGVWVFV